MESSLEIAREELSLVRVCEGCDIAHNQFGTFGTCARCNRTYCAHHASAIDQQFCTYCFHDFVIEDSIIRKTVESKSFNSKKVFTRVMKARHIVFRGQDWMFAQARICTLSDDQLGMSIEYHQEIKDQMIMEREARKIAKNKTALATMMRNSTLKIPSVKTGLNTDGTPIETIGMDATTVTTTTVKRTRISATQTNSTQVALAGIIAVFKAQGLSQEDIVSKLTAMAQGKK